MFGVVGLFLKMFIICFPDLSVNFVPSGKIVMGFWLLKTKINGLLQDTLLSNVVELFVLDVLDVDPAHFEGPEPFAALPPVFN